MSSIMLTTSHLILIKLETPICLKLGYMLLPTFLSNQSLVIVYANKDNSADLGCSNPACSQK